MLKFTGSVLVLISSVWIGFIFSERFKKKDISAKRNGKRHTPIAK